MAYTNRRILVAAAAMLTALTTMAGPVMAYADDPGGTDITDTVNTSPEVTAHDGKYTITIGTTMGTTLEGKTIEARRIATVGDNGQLETVDAARGALESAGGTGDNPAQDLLEQIDDNTIAPEELAQKLYPNIKDLTPDATTPGRASDDVVQATMDVDAGWYVVNATGTDDPTPEMVLAGDATGIDETAMTDGMALLTGVEDGSPTGADLDPNASSNGLLDSLSDGMSMFSLSRAKSEWDGKGRVYWGNADSLSGVDKKVVNFDFTARYGTSTYHAFCLASGTPQAQDKALYNVKKYNNDKIRTALWYGYMGPQSIFDSTKYTGPDHVSNVSAVDQRWATHLYVSAVFLGKKTDNPKFGSLLTGAQVVRIPGYKQIKKRAEQNTLPANVDYQPYIMFATKGSKVPYDSYNDNDGKEHPGFTLDKDDTQSSWRLQPIIFAMFNPSDISISTEMEKSLTFGGTVKTRDKIKLTVTGGKGWKKGEQLSLRVILHADYNGDGKSDAENDDYILVTADKDYRTGQTKTVYSKYFTTKDIANHTAWQAGKYWYDVELRTRITLDANGKVTSANFNKGSDRSPSLKSKSKSYKGISEDSESMTVVQPKITGSTEASASNVGTDNANPVADKITLNTDAPFDVTVSKVTVTLNYKGWAGTKSVSKTVANVTIPAGKSVTFWSPNFTPANLFGSGNWRNTAGDGNKYWFDVSINGKQALNSQSKKPIDVDVNLDGSNDDKEQFTVSGPDEGTFRTQARNTFNKAQGSMPVHDDVSSTADVDVKGTVTLNWDGDGDGKADKSKKSAEFTIKGWSTTASPDFTPADLGLTGSQWQGGDYWFDLDIPAQTGVDKAIHKDGKNDGAESWSSTGFEYMKAWPTSQAANGLASNWNNANVSAGTRFTSRTANLLIEGGTQNLTDTVRLNVQSLTGDRRSWDTNGDGVFDGNLRFTVKTTLHAPNGRTFSLSKDYASYYSAANAGSMTFAFKPANVGMTTWQHGDYWFTSVVTGVKGVSNDSGLACPANMIPVNGVKDDHLLCLKDYQTESSPLAASESVYIAPKFQPAISTKVTDATLDNGYPSWDDVTVTLPVTVSGLDIPVQGSLYWSPTKGAKSNTIPQNAKKVADTKGLTFLSRNFTKSADGRSYVQTIRFKASADANLKSLKNLGTGWYTYVWRIDKSGLAGKNVTVSWNYHGKDWWKTLTYKTDALLADMPATISDGWQPDTEQTQMNAKWRLAIEKVGYLGQKDGAFLDTRPAKGARMSMQETTDATGKTLKPGTTAVSITLNSDGKGTFAYQSINPGETRYYRVWETKVDKPFNLPKNGGYWIVTATNQIGSVGVHKVISNGSTDETKWLLHDAPEGDTTDRGVSTGSGVRNDPIIWTQKLGDTLDANVMPPSTGDAHDAGMTLLLTGIGLTVAILTAAIMIRRTRRTGR